VGCPLELVGVGRLRAEGMCGKRDLQFGFLLEECCSHGKTLCIVVIDLFCISLLPEWLTCRLPVSE
jgi:hypothetical protein